MCSVRRTLCRLGKFLVSWQGHVATQLYQDGLHRVLSLPLRHARKSCWVNLACLLINARQIDLAEEVNNWRGVWVSVAAVDLDRVYSILMCALSSLSALRKIQRKAVHDSTRHRKPDVHAAGPEWYRSSSTLLCRLHLQDRRSMPLPLE